jgi:hypothetical protein
MIPLVQKQEEDGESEKEIETEDAEQPPKKEEPRKAITITADQVKDLNLWRQVAERNFKKGKPIPADFECKSLDETMAGIIRLRLQNAKTLEDVTGAFEVQPEAKGYMKDMEVERMIQMLELNLQSIESEVKTVPDNYTFPVTVNVPAPIVNQAPAPDVTVNLPEMSVTLPPMQVANNVKVNPTPIENNVTLPEIKPTINVPEPTVVLKKKPQHITVTRGANGQITGLDANG